MQQLELISKPILSFGDLPNLNPRQETRVLATDKPIHLVLKAKDHSKLYQQRDFVQKTILKQAKRFCIKIYKFTVQGNHLHFLIQISSRDNYKKFVRVLTSLLSRRFGRGLWVLRPFTRVAHWGRDFENLQDYIYRNELELHGLTQYKHRSKTQYPNQI